MASDWDHDGPRRGTRLPFDPGVLAAIHQSAAVLARDQDAFIRQFHDDVKSLIPDSALPPAFDLRAFCDRMAQALLWVAVTERQPRLVVDALRQLGGQNWYEGFPDSQYASVAHALIQTVHYLSANIWSTSTGSAWISFFLWVQPHLLAGAQDAATREAAAREADGQQVNIERVTRLLDDDKDDDAGLGQITFGLTRKNPPRPLGTSQFAISLTTAAPTCWGRTSAGILEVAEEQLIADLRVEILPRLANQPTPERGRYLLSPILFPVEDLPATPLPE